MLSTQHLTQPSFRNLPKPPENRSKAQSPFLSEEVEEAGRQLQGERRRLMEAMALEVVLSLGREEDGLHFYSQNTSLASASGRLSGQLRRRGEQPRERQRSPSPEWIVWLLQQLQLSPEQVGRAWMTKSWGRLAAVVAPFTSIPAR